MEMEEYHLSVYGRTHGVAIASLAEHGLNRKEFFS